MRPDDNFPEQRTDNDNFFRYPKGPLGPDAQQQVIGGTHLMSTKLDPEQCLTGAYQPLRDDSMPAGAKVDGNPPYNGPYLPRN